mmetsp:Transcript_32100/g.63658  ORF Transcript_32100/g.63658 Transcript_32100/m.63658 type:complete len:172 (-) Transcript_32100:274-789(-)
MRLHAEKGRKYLCTSKASWHRPTALPIRFTESRNALPGAGDATKTEGKRHERKKYTNKGRKQAREKRRSYYMFLHQPKDSLAFCILPWTPPHPFWTNRLCPYSQAVHHFALLFSSEASVCAYKTPPDRLSTDKQAAIQARDTEETMAQFSGLERRGRARSFLSFLWYRAHM